MCTQTNYIVIQIDLTGKHTIFLSQDIQGNESFYNLRNTRMRA